MQPDSTAVCLIRGAQVTEFACECVTSPQNQVEKYASNSDLRAVLHVSKLK